MIGADAAPAPASRQSDQNQAFVDRATVMDRLQAMGISESVARERVAALTDAEAHAMAQKMDAMPVGGALSQTDWILILLVAILIIVAL
jgi:hypothetical protein